MVNLLGQTESIEQCHDAEIKRIKDMLQPGQALASVMVGSVGRPDHGHLFVTKMKAAQVSPYNLVILVAHTTFVIAP